MNRMNDETDDSGDEDGAGIIPAGTFGYSVLGDFGRQGTTRVPCLTARVAAETARAWFAAGAVDVTVYALTHYGDVEIDEADLAAYLG